MSAARQPVVGIQLSYPLDTPDRGATVLAAAIALFGPSDPVQLIVTPADGSVPTAAQAEEFGRECERLAAGVGPLPRLTLMPAARVDPATTTISLSASGDPAADAKTILILNSFGRKLGSTVGATPGTTIRPRGGADLTRTDAIAALLNRQLFSPPVPNGPLRMAVFLWSPLYWPGLETMVAAAQTHPDVELTVVALDHDDWFQARTAGQTQEFFAKQGVTPKGEGWLRANLRNLDVIVTGDPYDLQRPAGLHTRDLADAGVRLVHLPYAQALSGNPDNRWALYNLALHNIAWRIYVASTGQIANYRQSCEAGGDHVRYLGNVKRERLLSNRNADQAAQKIRRTLKTDTVTLWNPHFLDDLRTATFTKYIGAVFAHYTNNPRHGLLVRPHPLLLLNCERQGEQGKRLVADFRGMCADLPNVYLDEDLDPCPAMHAADSMISDLSSMMTEFLVFNRPTAWLRGSTEALLNNDQDWLSQVSVIDDDAQLSAFLNGQRKRGNRPQPRTEDAGSGARIVDSLVTDFFAETGRQRNREPAASAA
jgi:hypothetical protein